MAGILFAALAGGLEGMGQGMAKMGEQKYLEDNIKTKAELDQNREVMLQGLRNQSAEKVANISADATVQHANIAADASRAVAETGAGATIEHANITADASRANAETQAASHIEGVKLATAGHLAGIRESAKGIQTDEDGQVFRVVDGKAQYVLDPDGDPIKSSKDLTPKTKAAAELVMRRILQAEKEFNDPKNLIARNDPKQVDKYNAGIDAMTNQYYSILGLDPADFAPAAASPKPAPTGRPSLNTYMR